VLVGGAIRLPEVTKVPPGPGTLADGATFAEVTVVPTCAFKLLFVSISVGELHAGTKLMVATPTVARSSLRVCNLRGLGS
jgi:hypothetical protein